LDGSTLVGSWDTGVTVRRLQLDLGAAIGQGVGPWLIEHGLYSRGADFTSEMANVPGFIGSSTLRKLWEGKDSDYFEGMGQATLFVLLRKGKPEGVVAWVQPSHLPHMTHDDAVWFNKTPDHPHHLPKQRTKVMRLGHLMAFIQPHARGQGYCQRVIRELVRPELEILAQRAHALGAMPLLGASDAMGYIVGKHTTVPRTQYQTTCRAMIDDVWRLRTQAAMYPERSRPTDRWLGLAEAIPKTKRAPNKLRR
jgi:hypothetical protein